MSEATFAAVIVAGGRGRRFGGGTPKQCLDLAGRPVWRRSVDCFLGRPDVSQVVLVRPHGETFGDDVEGLDCVTGGDSRVASVFAGVDAVTDAPFAAVHDAARPLVKADEIDRLFAAAAEHGAAVPGHPVASTLRRALRGEARETVDRERLFEMQTPQVARVDWLREAAAFFRIFDDPEGDVSGVFTDEGELLMRYGTPVHVVTTSAENFKITTPEDLDLARAVWAARHPDGR